MKITKQQKQLLQRFKKQENEKFDKSIADMLDNAWELTYVQYLNK